MKVNYQPNTGETFHAFYLFFVIMSAQVGVGLLGVPNIIFKHSKQAAWISILIAYLVVLLVIVVMFIILSRYENADIFGIQKHLFGNWLGKFLGVLYLLFIFLELLSIFLTYIDILKVFIFPTVSSFAIAIIILFLIFYAVSGGIRVVVGTSFLFFFVAFLSFFIFKDPISRIDPTNYFPILDVTFVEILKGARATAYSLFGFQLLLFIFPFIEDKRKAKLPVFLAVSYSAFTLLFVTIISIGYFSLNQLDLVTWPTLTLVKTVSFSFLERFDYLIMTLWMTVVVSTGIFLMWAIVYGMERMFEFKQKNTLIVVSVLILILSTIATTTLQAQKLTDFQSKIGFFIVFIYPILLLPIVLIKTKNKDKISINN